MQPEVSLRLLDPYLMVTGIALLSMSACALAVAWRFRIWHLNLAALGLLLSALPWLIKGGVDALVWYNFVSHDTYPPQFLGFTAALHHYALFVAAASIVLATRELLRKCRVET